ncbi:MAG: QueT transporter family protein [Clostridia bacterium]|nr:QueT transporter family protein [Clostridia bacterium]
MNGNQTRSHALEIATGSMIAALYVVLTYVANALGLASGAIQIRISESLTILPVLMGSAIPGLAIGCVLANLLTGCTALDVVFGSLATLIGALGTRALRKQPKLAWLPPVISNMLIVPLVLIYVYQVPDVSVTIPFVNKTLSGSGFLPLMITVGIGEVISCGILGMLVYHAAQKAGIQKYVK